MIGGLVDRLQVTLVLELLARRGDVRMPALGHPPPRQLHLALVEGRLDLQRSICCSMSRITPGMTQHVTEPYRSWSGSAA